jgi:chromosome partitioning protein
MTKVIVNATHKGGEGKTTNSIVLGEYLALIANKKVLAMDLDPQANYSGRYLPMSYDPAYRGGKIPPLHPDFDPDVDTEWDGRSGIANIFYGIEVVPYPTSIQNLEITPAHSIKLQEAEAVTKSEVKDKVHNQLKKFVEHKDVQDSYDVIIIDTPPSKGPLTISAIKAATHLVIPAQMEQFSIEGIYGMLQLWKQETYSRTKDNPLELVGILPNQVRNINIHKNFLSDLRNKEFTSKYVIPHEIKKRAIYTEILAENANPKSIFELPVNNIERIEYELVCKYIAEKVFRDG